MSDKPEAEKAAEECIDFLGSGWVRLSSEEAFLLGANWLLERAKEEAGGMEEEEHLVRRLKELFNSPPQDTDKPRQS